MSFTIFSVTCRKLPDGEYSGAGDIHSLVSSQDWTSSETVACNCHRLNNNISCYFGNLTFTCKQLALAGTDIGTTAIPDSSVFRSSLYNTLSLLLMVALIFTATFPATEPSGYAALT